MAVKTAIVSKEKKYQMSCCTEDATCLSDGQGSRFITVDHCPPFELKQDCERYKALATIIVVLIVSLSLNVTLLVYITTGGTKAASPPPPPPPPHADRLVDAEEGESICTGCSGLGVESEGARSAHYPNLKVHQLTDGSLLCCMQNAGSLKRLAQILSDISVLASPPVNKSVTSLSTGAHLYVDSGALRKHPPSLAWSDEYGFGSAYVNNIIRHDNQLIVPEPGLYHIYSFITFKTLQQRSSPDNVLHILYRENRKLPQLGFQKVLMDKKTLPEAPGKFVTSFLSATVRLRQDDQLYVKVSNLSYIYAFAPSNFFGLGFLGAF